MLKPVKNDTGGKGYCGPTVVASITGKPLSKVLNAFREARYGPAWKRQFLRAPGIRGTSTGELRRALLILGYGSDMTQRYPHEPPTLAQWLRNRPPHTLTRTYVLVVRQKPGHWVVVRGKKLCDTFTKGQPVFIREAPHRRARVHEVLKIERL